MKQQLQLLLLIFLIIVVGVVGYGVLFGSQSSHELMVVSARSATVQETKKGETRALEPGMAVGVNAVVRTAKAGNVALQYGDGANLMLLSEATMTVLSADGAGVRVELEEGSISARVRAGMPPLGITNRGRAVNATDADFTVLVDKGGGLSAVARQGQLSLQGFSNTETLNTNEVLRAVPQQAPVVAVAPENLLLDVEWPDEPKTRAGEMELRGTTDPYASVVFGNGADAVRVRADRDGRFRATVALSEGQNDVELRVQDVMGREARQQRTVRRDSTAPIIRAAEVVWDK
jgi:hypothetical protein